MQREFAILVVLVTLMALNQAEALEGKDVYILANKSMPASIDVARHYAARRHVPPEQIVTLDLPTGEDISRADFNTRLRGPLRAALAPHRDQIKVLLTVHGVPLRVGPLQPSEEEKQKLEQLRPVIARTMEEQRSAQELVKKCEAELKESKGVEDAARLEQHRKNLKILAERMETLREAERALSHAESQAAVDSELSLLWWEDYPLSRWQDNLLNFQVPESARKLKPPIVMVARLDGPNPELAKRLVDQAVEVEAKGLEGKACIDARGIAYDPKADPGFGYGGYDASLRELAGLLQRETDIDTSLDDKPTLFPPDSCADCALYCGWYSLANYVACCRFTPGAVAYHIASSEAVSVRDPKCKYWCKNLLEAGAVATMGPVAEPYTIGFPKPAEFFGLLLTGRFTLIECYYKTLYLNSWMTVLIGDPLYRPYGKRPRLDMEKVRPSPAGGKLFWDAARKE